MPKSFRRAFSSFLILALLGPAGAVRAADVGRTSVTPTPNGGSAAGAKAADNGGSSAKPPANVDARAKLLQEANARLLAASRKNQCAFRKSSDVLLAGCDPKLKSLADTLLAVKKKLNRAGVAAVTFQVFGHTDSSGLPEFNREISERRASTIAREMVGRGVLPTEILSFGLASSKPLVTPDDTPAKQAKNQRYEIQLKL